jgi:hypothetical protein
MQTLAWEQPNHDQKNLVHYDLKAFHNPLDMEFLEKFNYCEVSSEPSPIEIILQIEPKDYNLADYNWMSDEIRKLMYQELLNVKIESENIPYKFFYETVAPSLTTYKFDNLESFAYYYITIRACYGSSENISSIECSEPTIKLFQTGVDVNADKVSNLCTDSSEPNTFEVFWDDPLHPNRAILNYAIRYNLVEAKETEAKIICVPFYDMKENRKKVVRGVSGGKYNVSVMVRSIAGPGLISMPSFVEVKEKSYLYSWMIFQ